LIFIKLFQFVISFFKDDQITAWKRQLSEGATAVFASSSSQEPGVDLKALHAKIGQLTLENDFLESALTKMGLLSAKR
jgi:transposase-like protein